MSSEKIVLIVTGAGDDVTISFSGAVVDGKKFWDIQIPDILTTEEVGALARELTVFSYGELRK